MKVFICGHPLYRYLNSIAEGFEANGWETEVFEFKNTNVLKLKSGNLLKRFKNRIILNKINTEIKQAITEYKPDLFLVINGEVLLEDTIKWINSKTKSALWLVDGAVNVKLPRSSMDLFHHRFILEPTDKELLKESTYLPYACDKVVYYNTESPKKYDVGFVGAGHVDRLEGLNKVAEFCSNHDFKFAVFGPFGVFKDKEMIEKYSFLYDAIEVNDKLSPEEVNELYNQTKININIHHSQSKEGVNTRVFEIFGSKNMQIVENKSYLKQLFSELPTVFTYNDTSELLANINELLNNTEKYTSELNKVSSEVDRKHTFKNRVHTILTVCKEGL